MLDIRTRLLQAEDDLLFASSSGSLEKFENEWAQLLDEITLAAEKKRLPEDILELANVISIRIDAITSSFLDLDTKSQDFSTSFMGSIISKEAPSHGQNATPIKLAIPPYIPLAYAWLIDNLHCPYPSTSMRNSLAEKSRSSRKAIDAWFIDVRKRIGWNALRRTRFGGKKDEIIRAATLFYCENKSDDSTGLEFASIESAARDLYADKLRPSAFISRFTETGEGRRPAQKDGSASVLSRQHATHHSPSSSSAPSSPYPITPSSKRTRSFDEFERETLDLTHSCQRPSKRLRLTSESSSPVSSRGNSQPRSSSLRQPSSNSSSESHSPRPRMSQWSVSGSDSSPSHQVSKQVNSTQEASTAVKNHTSSSREPKSSVVQSEDSTSGAQFPLRDDGSSVLGTPQYGHQSRCISEAGVQLSSYPKNNPRFQSVSNSVSSGTSGVSSWSFNPEVAQSGSVLAPWDSTTECDVATFDFSTWSPESLNQTELSLSLQVPSSGVQMGFPQPSIATNAFIAPPGDGISGLNDIGPFSDELLDFFDFFPQVPSKAGLATFPTSLPPHETGSFVAELGSNFDDDSTDTVEPFGWDIPDNIQEFLQPLAHQSAAASESEPATDLSGNDRIKKLKLLAEVKEFAHRLEAEIAVM